MPTANFWFNQNLYRNLGCHLPACQLWTITNPFSLSPLPFHPTFILPSPCFSSAPRNAPFP